jgi:hypothetical protein
MSTPFLRARKTPASSWWVTFRNVDSLTKRVRPSKINAVLQTQLKISQTQNRDILAGQVTADRVQAFLQRRHAAAPCSFRGMKPSNRSRRLAEPGYFGRGGLPDGAQTFLLTSCSSFSSSGMALAGLSHLPAWAT